MIVFFSNLALHRNRLEGSLHTQVAGAHLPSFWFSGSGEADNLQGQADLLAQRMCSENCGSNGNVTAWSVLVGLESVSVSTLCVWKRNYKINVGIFDEDHILRKIVLKKPCYLLWSQKCNTAYGKYLRWRGQTIFFSVIGGCGTPVSGFAFAVGS